jgi:hypothetical protein
MKNEWWSIDWVESYWYQFRCVSLINESKGQLKKKYKALSFWNKSAFATFDIRQAWNSEICILYCVSIVNYTSKKVWRMTSNLIHKILLLLFDGFTFFVFTHKKKKKNTHRYSKKWLMCLYNAVKWKICIY